RIMAQILCRVEALPVAAPRLHSLCDLAAQFPGAARRRPFDAVRDDDRREPDLDGAGDLDQVLVVEDHAAVTGPRRPAVGVRWRAVQPDPVAVAALAPVPLVGIVDGKRTAAV